MSEGQMMLPECKNCRVKKCKPILVGTINQVDKERTRQAAKQAAKQAKSKQKPTAPLPTTPLPREEEETEGEAGSSSGGGSRGNGTCTGGSIGAPPSGAAKRHKAKEAAAATAAAPSLGDLIAAVLPSFKSRGQAPIFRSSLRQAVRKLDKVKPERSFGDKDEWKV